MATIVFFEPDGTEKSVTARIGQSIMEVAVQNGVNGIEADCGGACSCATCHGYIDEAWFDRLNPPQGVELDMLEFALDTAPNSRLTCQIPVSEDMDGLVIRLPQAQA